jgi:hypothetical protein
MAGKAILVGCIGTILLILVVFCPIHITPIGRFTLLGYICPGGRCVLTGSLPQESLDGTFRGVLETTFVDKNSHSKITETTYQVQVGSYQSKQHVLRQSQIRLTIPVALPSFPRSFSRDEVEITAILRGNGVVFSDGSTQKSAFGGPGGGTVYYSTTDVPIQETVGRAELRLRSGNWFDTLTRWSLSTIGQLSIGVLYLLLLDWICFVVFELVKEKKS